MSKPKVFVCACAQMETLPSPDDSQHRQALGRYLQLYFRLFHPLSIRGLQGILRRRFEVPFN